MENGEWWKGTVENRTSKATSKKYPNNWMVNGENGTKLEINFNQMIWRREATETKALAVMVPRSLHGTKDVLEAKKKELALLKEFKAYKVIREDEAKEGVDILDTVWVVTKKEVDGKEVIKARLCARGFQETTEIRRDSPTVSKVSLRILFLLAASKNWEVKSLDAKSAFLQGGGIDMLVYVVPPDEGKKSEGTLWQLRKRLYGLGEAGSRTFRVQVQKRGNPGSSGGTC